jgi:hypothetical protein
MAGTLCGVWGYSKNGIRLSAGTVSEWRAGEITPIYFEDLNDA